MCLRAWKIRNIRFKKREAEVENFLRTLCAEQIPLRYRTEQLDPVRAVYPDQDPMEVIAKRLDYELNLITSKGMSDYLLIVYDFIAWAKRNGIPMGLVGDLEQDRLFCT